MASPSTCSTRRRGATHTLPRQVSASWPRGPSNTSISRLPPRSKRSSTGTLLCPATRGTWRSNRVSPAATTCTRVLSAACACSRTYSLTGSRSRTLSGTSRPSTRTCLPDRVGAERANRRTPSDCRRGRARQTFPWVCLPSVISTRRLSSSGAKPGKDASMARSRSVAVLSIVAVPSAGLAENVFTTLSTSSRSCSRRA